MSERTVTDLETAALKDLATIRKRIPSEPDGYVTYAFQLNDIELAVRELARRAEQADMLEEDQEWIHAAVAQRERAEAAEADHDRLAEEYDQCEQRYTALEADRDRLQAVVKDVWGTMLAYHTDIPEAEVQRLVAACESVNDLLGP